MPYIAQDLRPDLVDALDSVFPDNPGELNFTFSHLINRYLGDSGLNYRAINEVIGVLECAKLELYRRVAAPYEDKKLVEHGDVYE